MIHAYQLLLQIVRLIKPLLKLVPHEKVQYFFKREGKINAEQTLKNRPLWIHASSGEIEYAKSLIREIQIQFPETPLLVTHTSLSSEKAIKQLGVQAWGVAPLDTPQDVRNFLNKWKPKACLIARTDLWPQTLMELHKSKIPTYLFSATFASGSKKTSFLARQLLRSTLPLITKIYFVSAADEKLCRSLFPQIKGEIAGDTRYDQVLYRLKNTPSLPLPGADRILIAGSTWLEDEQILIPAFEKLAKQNWKFILVPHEISAAHMVRIRELLEMTTLRYHFYSQGTQFAWDQYDILLVDQVGILASLYPHAQIAFVGGSFRKQVHSVMEALATLSPVIVGPFHHNNREAIEFKELGLVKEVMDSASFGAAAESFATQLGEMKPLLDQEIQKRLGTTAKILLDLKAQGLFGG